MPGFLTHYLAGQKLKASLPGLLTQYLAGQQMGSAFSDEAMQKILHHEKLFSLGCQGPDIFFYYLPGLVIKKPRYYYGTTYNSTRGLGTLMHNQNFGKFLLEMASLCKSDKTGAVFAYTSGLVMHYALDSTAHPYVYAKTTSNAGLFKNTADHRLFETAIDMLMLMRLKNQKPNDLVRYELIDADEVDLQTAAKAVSCALNRVYSHKLVHVQVFSAMKYMIRFTKLLQTKRGLRKKILRFIEGVTVREPLFSSMMHDQKTEMDVLNLEKNEWLAPWEGAQKKEQSFIELFDGAIYEAAEMCRVLAGFAYGEEGEKTIAGVIGNKSLKTGENC